MFTICSCTETHYKILRASASMKRENNCMCKHTLSQENLILIIYLVRFEIYLDNLHYIYAAQAQSDQLISAQSRRLQTQNEIPKFSIRQTIPNFVK